MAHAQKPDFVFRRNGRVHLNQRGRQFTRLLVAEVCASAVVILDTPCSEVVWRVLATHSIHQFPLHFLSRVITFKLDSTTKGMDVIYLWFKTLSWILYESTPVIFSLCLRCARMSGWLPRIANAPLRQHTCRLVVPCLHVQKTLDFIYPFLKPPGYVERLEWHRHLV